MRNGNLTCTLSDVGRMQEDPNYSDPNTGESLADLQNLDFPTDATTDDLDDMDYLQDVYSSVPNYSISLAMMSSFMPCDTQSSSTGMLHVDPIMAMALPMTSESPIRPYTYPSFPLSRCSRDSTKRTCAGGPEHIRTDVLGNMAHLQPLQLHGEHRNLRSGDLREQAAPIPMPYTSTEHG